MYRTNKSEDWHWFEPVLSYDNGIIPFALFQAFEITGDEELLKTAKESMLFLDETVFSEGYISLIGSDKWFRKDEIRSPYDQQPVDAMAMVLMYHQAFIVSGDNQYLKKMFSSFMWFLGDNDLRLPLYDFETHGCNDGLESKGVNRNQGAESTLSYLIAYLTVITAYENAL